VHQSAPVGVNAGDGGGAVRRIQHVGVRRQLPPGVALVAAGAHVELRRHVEQLHQVPPRGQLLGHLAPGHQSFGDPVDLHLDGTKTHRDEHCGNLGTAGMSQATAPRLAASRDVSMKTAKPWALYARLVLARSQANLLPLSR